MIDNFFCVFVILSLRLINWSSKFFKKVVSIVWLNVIVCFNVVFNINWVNVVIVFILIKVIEIKFDLVDVGKWFIE